MSDQKTDQLKLLLEIQEHLIVLSKGVENLNSRMEKLEGKTDDMHSLVPFGRWLEGFSRSCASKLYWTKTNEIE